MKKVLSVFLAVVILLSCAPISGSKLIANAEPYNGEYMSGSDKTTVKSSKVSRLSGYIQDNTADNDYSSQNWAEPMKSFLAENGDGTLTRVQAGDENVVIEKYDTDTLELLSTKYISYELSIFGGFFSGTDYNFLVFGQTNSSESDYTEVVRVVKYDKSWNRLSHCSINGANTNVPFYAGSLRMDENDENLYIHTAHKMYKSKDGKNHQANMSFIIRKSDLSVLKSYHKVSIEDNIYASHSFNQFVKVDDNFVYRADHGDAYPRSIYFSACSLDIDNTKSKYIYPFKFSGGIGDNYTGASLGGFELSDNNCVLAFESIDQDEYSTSETRNIMIISASKDFSSTDTKMITQYTDSDDISVSTPQLVKIGNNQFIVLWEEYVAVDRFVGSGKNKYYNNAFYMFNETKAVGNDDKGNMTTDIVSLDMRLSDCQPIFCDDGLIRWYTSSSREISMNILNPLPDPTTEAPAIKVMATKTDLNVGETAKIKLLNISDEIKNIASFDSSNPKVISVSEDGEVFAWAEGFATVNVDLYDGTSTTISFSVSAKTNGKSSQMISLSGYIQNNASDNDYSSQNWAAPMKSYLAENNDGTLTRVQAGDENVVIEKYDTDTLELLSTKYISYDLPIFGGFFSGTDYNFLVFGQTNSSESDNTEVVRVVKYDKLWNRLSHCSVNGANTTVPFDAGSLRMDETDENLYIYTAHEMYTYGDGLNQANMTFVINKSHMTVVDSSYNQINYYYGYVKRSFNQFIKVDGDIVYRADHGNTYPRGIYISSCNTDDSITDVNYYIPFEFKGYEGEKYTGASIGGFELSDYNCVLALESIDQDEYSTSETRNIMIITASKDFSSTDTKMITQYTDSDDISVSTPQLVKIGNNQFIVLWEEYVAVDHFVGSGRNKYYNNAFYMFNETKAVGIDDKGNMTTDIVSLDMRLSDCQPIFCDDGLIRWYTSSSREISMNILNPFPLKGFEKSTVEEPTTEAPTTETPTTETPTTETPTTETPTTETPTTETPTTETPTTETPTTEAPTTETLTAEEPTTETLAAETPITEAPSTENPSYMLGDINGDNKITAVDARIILRISARLENIEEFPNAILIADVNGDGKITAVDARKVLRVAAKLDSLDNDITTFSKSGR